jgi:hypothetical protein
VVNTAPQMPELVFELEEILPIILDTDPNYLFLAPLITLPLKVVPLPKLDVLGVKKLKTGSRVWKMLKKKVKHICVSFKIKVR